MNTTFLFRQLFDSATSTYTYLLADSASKEAVMIDPVVDQIKRDEILLQELDLKLLWILETHIHADHITGAYQLKKITGAHIGLGKITNIQEADRLFNDGEEVTFGSQKLKAIFTPGHTEGCTSYLLNDSFLFSGDALMIRGCGRTDFQDGSSSTLFRSVREKLFSLPDSVLVYPAHDYQGRTSSTIGEEKKFNPRLKLSNSRDDFVRIMQDLKLEPPKHIQIAVPANNRLGRME